MASSMSLPPLGGNEGSLLSLTNIIKSYPSGTTFRKVLDNLSPDIYKGETIAIVARKMKVLFLLFIILLNVNFLSAKSEIITDSGDNHRLDSIIFETLDTNTNQYSITQKTFKMYDDITNTTTSINYKFDPVSNLFVTSSKYELTYNSNHKIILEIHYSWDKNSGLSVPSNKYELAFDTNSNRTLKITSQWDKTINQFVCLYKEEYIYNENSLLIQNTNYNWNKKTNDFIPMNKLENEYNTNGDITLTVKYIWDNGSNKFNVSGKVEYIFDARGNNTQFLQSAWDNITNQFIYVAKSDYSFNSTGNDTLILSYNWDKNKNLFEFYSKSEIEYDKNNNPTLFYKYWWDITNNLFYLIEKQELIYNTNNQVIMYNDSVMNSSFEWNNFLHEFTFDSNGNETIFENYVWSFEINDWVLTSKKESTYTSFAKISQIIQYSKNENTGTVSFSKTTYYYSEDNTVKISKFNSPDFKIYPNPVSNGFKVNGLNGEAELNIFDTNGNIRHKCKLENDVYIPINNLADGIYFIKIQTKNRSVISKLIKN